MEYKNTFKYIYGMRLRPFGIGCQPEGFINVENSTKKETGYYSFLTYSKELSAETLKNYELDFIKKELDEQNNGV